MIEVYFITYLCCALNIYTENKRETYFKVWVQTAKISKIRGFQTSYMFCLYLTRGLQNESSGGPRYHIIPNQSTYPNKCTKPILKELEILILWVFKASLYNFSLPRYSCLKFCLFHVRLLGILFVWTTIFNSQYLSN